MKKLSALLLCLTMVLTFAACKKDEDKLLEDEQVLFDVTSAESQTSSDISSDEGSGTSEGTESQDSSSVQSQGTESTSSKTENNETEKPENTEEEEKFDTGMDLIQSGGYYFPDIDETYKYAAEIYRDIVNSTFSYDEDLGVYEIEKDGSVGNYWRVNDSRFDSVAQLEAYLDAFFTDECQATFYDPARFIDHNGHLYAVVGVVAEDPTYAGCSFKLTKQTTKRIFFEGTAYYYKTYEEIDPSKPLLTTAPEDPTVYNTRTVSFVMQASEDGMNWYFTQFGMI